MNANETLNIETKSEEETIDLARQLGAHLKPGDVVALVGELGAGKTRFVRGLAQGLGLDPSQVCSPTFVLVNMYDQGEAATPLIHIDAYRLSSADELAELGWDQIFDGTAVVAIEWAQRVRSDLPDSCIDVTLEHAEGGQTRRIRINLPEGCAVDFRP